MFQKPIDIMNGEMLVFSTVIEYLNPAVIGAFFPLNSCLKLSSPLFGLCSLLSALRSPLAYELSPSRQWLELKAHTWRTRVEESTD
jgi:hypothetical protein